MKKLLLTMLGVALVATGNAQTEGVSITPQKINVQKLKDAISKSDAEIADAKKAAKAATWINRGDAFYNADATPVNSLFAGMEEATFRLAHGNALSSESVTLGNAQYTVHAYEHFKAYAVNGAIEFFVPITIIDAGALDKAGEAYAKAYEIDAKTAKKVTAGMENIRIKSFENGSTYYTLGDYKAGADNFRRAYRVSTHPSLAKPDSVALYYAGMTSVYANDLNAAVDDLDKVIAMGYEAEGEAYRLKFIALYNLERKEESLEVLKNGISRHPANENLIDMMMRYYAENDGDPTSMIPMVEEAIAKNPTNASLYQGLARVYDKLGQSDNAIDAIQKAVALTPDDFVSNYLMGLFIVQKGDKMNEEVGRMTTTSNTQRQEAQDAVNAVFLQAIAPLEKAHGIDPSEIVAVELLKNLSFRFSDDPAMNEMYEKYNALFNSMNGN